MPRRPKPGAIPRRRSPYTAFLDTTKNRTSPDDVAARIAERDEREAQDARTPAQVLLNDPPRWRSALSAIGGPRFRQQHRPNPMVWKITLNR
jgi:hypothetical protein